ncbi:MAG: redoxin domain-containing protein, partial [Planctomycetota bacterium]
PQADVATLPKFELRDPRGRTWTQADLKDNRVTVVAFLGTECPLAKLYGPRIGQIAAAFEGQVQVVGVMPNSQDSLEEIAAYTRRGKIDYPIAKDPAARFAKAIGATRTPEVFVFDRQRRLRYQGRIDDQYGIGYVRDNARTHDLKDQLEKLVSAPESRDSTNSSEAKSSSEATDSQRASKMNPPIAVIRTAAPGCLIGQSPRQGETSEVTYVSHIAEILKRQCVSCHREGEIGPFPLTDYESAAGWADMIVETIEGGRMPPWHATPGKHDFANLREVTADELAALKTWADAGAPSGFVDGKPPTPLPEAPPKVAGWQLPATPDHVFNVSPEPFEVAAEGTIRYQYFAVDPEFDTDVWFRAAELLPGNRSVVHHILCFAAPKDKPPRFEAVDSFLVAYVPGARVQNYPRGYAKKIPANSRLIFQVHYTPTGTQQFDQSQLGLVLIDESEVTHEIVTTSAVQIRLNIPPGEPNYETYALSAPFPESAELLSMSPHMHVRGSAYRYELLRPDGSRETLLDIPEYDFNWQTTYRLSKPIKMTGGEQMFCTAKFDNSADNLSNPDPQAKVRWGDQTWDEMMIGYFHYAVKKGTPESDQGRRYVGRSIAKMRQFEKLDPDNDGRVARSDTPRLLRTIFDRMDRNEDGTLTREEAVLYDPKATP